MTDKVSRPSLSSQSTPRVLQTSEGDISLLTKLDVEGRATVYRGQHVQLRRDVLIKLYAGGPTGGTNLQEQRRRVLEFRHPDAVRVFACGENAQYRYVVQDFLDSPRLKDLSKLRISVALNQALAIVIQIGKILAAAHQEGIAHLRLASENVWIEGGRRVRLSGFGERFVDKLPSRIADKDPETMIRADIADLAKLFLRLMGDGKASESFECLSRHPISQEARKKLEGTLDAALEKGYCSYDLMREFVSDLERLNLAAEMLFIREFAEKKDLARSTSSSSTPRPVLKRTVRPLPRTAPVSPETSQPPAPKKPMDRLWLVSVGGEVRSAAGSLEIVQMLQAGDLRPTDMIKPTRGGTFQKISDVEDFADVLKSLPKNPVHKNSVPDQQPLSPECLTPNHFEQPSNGSKKEELSLPSLNKMRAASLQSQKSTTIPSATRAQPFPGQSGNTKSREVQDRENGIEDLGDELILIRCPNLELSLPVAPESVQSLKKCDSSEEIGSDLILISPPTGVEGVPLPRLASTQKGGSWSRFGVRKGILLGFILTFIAANAYFLSTAFSQAGISFRFRGNERGYVSKTYVNPEGEKFHYSLFIPYRLKLTDRPPVILHLHGGGGGEGNSRNQVGSLIGQTLWRLREDFPFIVIFPQARPDQDTWPARGKNAQAAIHILDQVIRDYWADEDRVYLMGASSGGAGVWNLVSLEPDRFAAIVPICAVGLYGSMARTTDQLAEIVSDQNVQVWSGANLEDRDFINWFNEGIRKSMLQQGRSPYFIRYAETGHDAWGNTYNNPAMYAWLLQQSRIKNRGHDPLFSMLSRKNYERVFDISHGTHTLRENGALLIEMRDNASPPLLTLKQQPAEFELHFDLSLDRAGGLRLWFGSSDKNPKNGYAAVLMRPEEGNGGLKAPGSQEWICSNNSYAENSLQVSFNNTLPGWNDVRLTVKEGLLSLQINGWYAFQQRISPKGHHAGPIAMELIPQIRQQDQTAQDVATDNRLFSDQGLQQPAILLQDLRIRVPEHGGSRNMAKLGALEKGANTP